MSPDPKTSFVTPPHVTTREGLAKKDLPLPRIVPRRRPDLFARLRRWWRERQEFKREQRLILYRLKTLLEQAEAFRLTIQMEGKRIAASEQRAQIRLQTLQKNHEVLRDALNAQGEALEQLQQKVK